VEGNTAIAECLGKVRLRHKRAVVTCQRFLESLQFIECIPTIVQSKSIGGISFKGGLYLLEGRRMIAALIENDPKQMQAVKMIGLRGKNLFVDAFSVCQSAGSMQRECLS
jgi:hypothetical protein